MKKPGFIDSVRIKDPCTQAWDEMIGNDKTRFCTHCAKDVNNLSVMTRKEALKLVRRSGGSLCIRYVQEPVTKAPLFSEQLTQITRRRAPLMAAGVMTASLSLSALTYAQGGAMVPARETPAAARVNAPAAARVSECEDVAKDVKAGPSTDGTAGVMRGRVVDPNGAVVPAMTVSLIDEGGKQVGTAKSDDSGEFRFDALPRGSFSVRTEARAGLAASQMDHVIVQDLETLVDITVRPSGDVILSGVVAVGAEFEGKLAVAVANDDLEGARDLLVRGESVNHKEDDGTTPLFIAVHNGNLEMVELLLNFGAKVNARNQEKETALMNIDEDASLELVQLLIRYGAKINQVAKNGDTALIRAARDVKPEILKALVDAGADLNAQNEEGMTALMNAADAEHLENARVLVLAGADVNLKDNEGETAWDHTAKEEIEELLVSHGAIVEDEEPDELEAEPDND